jgi:hypothetical protein
MGALSSLTVLLLLACNGDDTTDSGSVDTGSTLGTDSGGTIPDADDDDYPADVDCDDDNPDIYPGADETCNGADDDCDDEIDEEALDATPWYADSDGDGLGDPAVVTDACDQPDDTVDNALDCNDGDSEIGEAATWYHDADHDGYGDGETTGCDQPPDTSEVEGDCDDSDDSVYPGAEEICSDGVVNDCDGTADDAIAGCGWPASASDTDADVTITHTYDEAFAWYNIAGPGDLNGDGVGDLLVSAPWTKGISNLNFNGGVYILYGPVTSGALADADASIISEGTSDNFGSGVDWAGDLNGDGYDDLVVGAQGAGDNTTGAVYLFLGPVTAGTAVDTAVLTVTGTDGYSTLGSSVASGGDADGDGVNDLLVGGFYNNDVELYGGAAFFISGSETGTTDTDAAAFSSWFGEEAWDGAGIQSAYLDDVNGDGIGDWAIVATKQDNGDWDRGVIYVLHGPVSAGSYSLADADAKLAGAGTAYNLGRRLASGIDDNGDGYGDLWASTHWTSDGGSYLFRGPLTADRDTTEADASLIADYAGTNYFMGTVVSAPGDLDQDGFDDVVLGSGLFELDNSGASYREAYGAFLFMGPVSGNHDESSAATHFLSSTGSTRWAGNVGSPGDISGDGAPDLVIASLSMPTEGTPDATSIFFGSAF